MSPCIEFSLLSSTHTVVARHQGALPSLQRDRRGKKKLVAHSNHQFTMLAQIYTRGRSKLLSDFHCIYGPIMMLIIADLSQSYIWPNIKCSYGIPPSFSSTLKPATDVTRYVFLRQMTKLQSTVYCLFTKRPPSERPSSSSQ